MTLTSASARPAHRKRHVERGPRPEDQVLRLADRRRLGYSESGDPEGAPVLFFHGFGTTRVICPPAQPAEELGIRLIAVDRPGIGLSDPKPGRNLLDWPADIAELADHLALDSFSIVGWSGGSPYALACGLAMADRVRAIAAGTVSSRAPWVIRLAMWHWGRGQRRDAERFFEKSVADMCAADQEVLTEPELRSRMIANSTELYRQGGRGMYDEALI
ncbi:MAG TPA: alpha/beta hydrolase, partial [Candidatus Limnocylindrales bacterium]|nr:alpha/beta hydrolase [Candidatus Limnocylindrales bacterium]